MQNNCVEIGLKRAQLFAFNLILILEQFSQKSVGRLSIWPSEPSIPKRVSDGVSQRVHIIVNHGEPIVELHLVELTLQKEAKVQLDRSFVGQRNYSVLNH